MTDLNIAYNIKPYYIGKNGKNGIEGFETSITDEGDISGVNTNPSNVVKQEIITEGTSQDMTTVDTIPVKSTPTRVMDPEKIYDEYVKDMNKGIDEINRIITSIKSLISMNSLHKISTPNILGSSDEIYTIIQYISLTNNKNILNDYINVLKPLYNSLESVYLNIAKYNISLNTTSATELLTSCNDVKLSLHQMITFGTKNKGQIIDVQNLYKDVHNKRNEIDSYMNIKNGMSIKNMNNNIDMITTIKKENEELLKKVSNVEIKTIYNLEEINKINKKFEKLNDIDANIKKISQVESEIEMIDDRVDINMKNMNDVYGQLKELKEKSENEGMCSIL
jgi:hypothetical protein